MRTSCDPVAALETRVAQDPAQPLLTCYDEVDGSRVEFSARTFANWVDKTANLVGSLVDPDEPVEVGLPLLLTHPGHWVSLVWAMATWQAGGRVLALPRDDLDRVHLAVVGPDLPHPVPGVETVACSLHPLGLGLPQPVVGVTDYAEVLGEPDVHVRGDHPAVWFDDATRKLRDDDLLEVSPVGGRLLLRPSGEPWRDLRDLLVAPLLGGGSVVIVRGRADEQRLATLAAAEHAVQVG